MTFWEIHNKIRSPIYQKFEVKNMEGSGKSRYQDSKKLHKTTKFPWESDTNENCQKPFKFFSFTVNKICQILSDQTRGISCKFWNVDILEGNETFCWNCWINTRTWSLKFGVWKCGGVANIKIRIFNERKQNSAVPSRKR